MKSYWKDEYYKTIPLDIVESTLCFGGFFCLFALFWFCLFLFYFSANGSVFSKQGRLKVTTVSFLLLYFGGRFNACNLI